MKASQTHYPSLLSTLTFLLGIATALGISAVTGVGALINFASKRTFDVSALIISAVYGFQSLLLIWITFQSIRKFLHKPAADDEISYSIPRWQIIAFLVGAGLSILTGHLIADVKWLNWIALPILTIPAVVLPIWFFFGVGTTKLSLGARWKAWSILGISMTAAPFLLIILELIVGIIMGALVVVYVMTTPEIFNEIERLVEQMMFIDPYSEQMVNLIMPLISSPKTIVLFLSYFALIVPAIEELIKPLAVWLFVSKIESTAQGFAFGAICGAGYALIETLGVSGQSTGWSVLLATRVGTGLLHIATSAIMGAGIVALWHKRQYLFALGAYMLSSTLHGLWNAAAISYSFAAIGVPFFQLPGFLTAEIIIISTMGILAICFFAILIVANRRFRITPPAVAESAANS